MSTALDPREFLADPSVRPMARTRRVDLAAPDVPRLNTNEYVVYDNTTRRNEVEIVRYLVPFAQERTDVGTPAESYAPLDPAEANGHFVFSPKLNGKTVDNIDIGLNTPRALAGPLSNADRYRAGGINFISMDPWVDSQRYNPLFSIPVPAETQFLVTFSIVSTSTVAPVPNEYQIGAGAKRVDFAGVIVSGVIMPQQLYGKLLEDAMNGRMPLDQINNLFDLIQSGLAR